MIYLLSIKNFKALVPLQLGVTNKKKSKNKNVQKLKNPDADVRGGGGGGVVLEIRTHPDKGRGVV